LGEPTIAIIRRTSSTPNPFVKKSLTYIRREKNSHASPRSTPIIAATRYQSAFKGATAAKPFKEAQYSPHSGPLSYAAISFRA
jgi:hypothetical protein